jgi:hypothetical protein
MNILIAILIRTGRKRMLRCGINSANTAVRKYTAPVGALQSDLARAASPPPHCAGEVAADQWGLVTLPQVKVGKARNRITIER